MSFKSTPGSKHVAYVSGDLGTYLMSSALGLMGADGALAAALLMSGQLQLPEVLCSLFIVYIVVFVFILRLFSFAVFFFSCNLEDFNEEFFSLHGYVIKI